MKHIHLSIYLCLLGGFTLTSCQSQEEQKLEELDKKSAREVTLATVKQGDSVLHITTQNLWYKGEKIASKSDTIVTPLHISSWDASDTSKGQTMSQIPIYVTVQ